MKSRLALPFLLAFGFACVSNAQVNARLTGSVVDPSGLAVPGATVDVFLPGGAKPVLSMSTTAEGLFAFSAVLPGHYDVIVTAAGFRKSANRDVILSTGEETALPTIRLEVGGATEIIEVKENAETIQT